MIIKLIWINSLYVRTAPQIFLSLQSHISKIKYIKNTNNAMND